MLNFINQYYNNYAGDKNIIFNVVERGITLMRDSLDEDLYRAWQEYAKTSVKLYSERKGIFIYNDYLSFISSIFHKRPYQKLKDSLDYLLKIVKIT